LTICQHVVHHFQERAVYFIAAKLNKSGEVYLGLAADMAGLPKLTFIEILIVRFNRCDTNLKMSWGFCQKQGDRCFVAEKYL
jgi:hypothetical protein